MEHTQRSLPRDVFVHLLMIATLYAAVGAFIALLFQYVNVLFPDALSTYYPSVRDSIRRSEAILFVVFPCYIFLSWLIERDLAKNPAMREFKVRKWLVYFTLFISAIAIITDLVVLIYNFLGGDLTVSFMLKILVVLASAGAVFGYYIWDLRRKSGASRIPRIAATASALVVLAALVGGFFIVGSPATERSRRFDEQRIQHLQTIQNEIVNYWMRKEKLPDSLDALKDSISGFTPPQDPETQMPYEYRTRGKLSFEFCATFTTNSGQNEKGGAMTSPLPAYRDPYSTGVLGDTWQHGTGRTCFTRTIDPELYKLPKPAL